MHKIFGLLAVALGLTAVALGQSTGQPAQANALPAEAHPAPQQVVINVVVQDKDGHPVHGLKAANFRLSEDGAAQTISHFQEHATLAQPQSPPKAAALPPGMFTDFPSLAPDSTLNILIVDALNTPMNDQRSLYSQLQQYVNAADPKAHLAIFGLANYLVLLQDFDSDPSALKNVMNHKLIPRSASLVTRVGASGDAKQSLTNTDRNTPSAAQLAANLEEFLDQTRSIESQLRPQLTLDAFNTLGHYLAALPGRKNVIWFSGSFPLSLSANPSAKNDSDLANLDQDESRQTIDLLAKAQVSVYPLDARALLSRPSHDASTKKVKLSAEESKFTTSPTVEHARMTALAADTGGKSFSDVTNLSDAIGKAIDAGTNFYALSYTPAGQQQDGKYRQVAVDLTAAAAGSQLSYDRGYFAQDAVELEAEKPQPVASPATAPAAADTTHGPAAAYARAAMTRGAPAPDGVLFKVRVLPAAAVTETKIAPGNTLDPSVSPTGPFRNFNVDYVSLLRELTLHQEASGRRTGGVEFVVYVFDTDGRLLNAVGKQVTINLSTTTYQRVVNSAMEFHLEISVPTAQDTFLRMGMRDVPSNKFGVVEIPTSSVINLNPLELKAAPLAKQAPTPANASPTTPSTTQPPASAPSTPPAPSTAPNDVPPS